MKGETHEINPFSSSACQEFELLLAEWPEGGTSGFLEEHARLCLSCTHLLADVKLILSESQNLPPADPPQNLWPGLRRQLIEEGLIRQQGYKLRRWLPVWYRVLPTPGFVGALASLIILGLVILLPRVGPPGGSTARQTPAGESAQLVAVAAVELPPLIQAKIGPALSAMEQSYQVKASSLPPEMTAACQRCVRTLDNTIQECLNAMAEDSDNTLAQEYLLLAYKQKAEVLTAALEWER